ncbi:DNA repair protein RecO [Cochlodiniinecator piscidefendens]|uniref:DNA repair protein RecO n=1 Tax=Cochlodiniinecator piscidefendens TaxID=2715756 RepID=UPI00140CCE47|nr:DNA repair protein RecO [Cochlodiniinecator piscidefendens]
MEWRDEGVLLSVRKHGETSVIIDVLTASHGRHAGVVRGGVSRKMTPILQPGSQLDLIWRARLSDHLGSFTVEPIRSRTAGVMNDRLALAGLNAIAALVRFALPEREAHPGLFQGTVTLLDLLSVTDAWPLAYLRWELALLDELGFGLDLSRCAVTGSFDDLAYVSPRTGRAVSQQGAGEWADRLLPLPLCLLGQGDASDREIVDGLSTTGHFLAGQLAHSVGKQLPAARDRLIDLLARQG